MRSRLQLRGLPHRFGAIDAASPFALDSSVQRAIDIESITLLLPSYSRVWLVIEERVAHASDAVFAGDRP